MNNDVSNIFMRVSCLSLGRLHYTVSPPDMIHYTSIPRQEVNSLDPSTTSHPILGVLSLTRKKVHSGYPPSKPSSLQER